MCWYIVSMLYLWLLLIAHFSTWWISEQRGHDKRRIWRVEHSRNIGRCHGYDLNVDTKYKISFLSIASLNNLNGNNHFSQNCFEGVRRRFSNRKKKELFYNNGKYVIPFYFRQTSIPHSLVLLFLMLSKSTHNLIHRFVCSLSERIAWNYFTNIQKLSQWILYHSYRMPSFHFNSNNKSNNQNETIK